MSLGLGTNGGGPVAPVDAILYGSQSVLNQPPGGGVLAPLPPAQTLPQGRPGSLPQGPPSPPGAYGPQPWQPAQQMPEPWSPPAQAMPPAPPKKKYVTPEPPKKKDVYPQPKQKDFYPFEPGGPLAPLPPSPVPVPMPPLTPAPPMPIYPLTHTLPIYPVQKQHIYPMRMKGKKPKMMPGPFPGTMRGVGDPSWGAFGVRRPGPIEFSDEATFFDQPMPPSPAAEVPRLGGPYPVPYWGVLVRHVQQEFPWAWSPAEPSAFGPVVRSGPQSGTPVPGYPLTWTPTPPPVPPGIFPMSTAGFGQDDGETTHKWVAYLGAIAIAGVAIALFVGTLKVKEF